MPERKSARKKSKFPSTTVIGSYPITVPESEIEQFRSFPEETEDPVNSSIQLAVRDFISAGIEFPSTGQTRESFVRLFLDPDHVEGIEYNGSEILVRGKIRRKSSIRLADVQEAKSLIPRYYGFKEPVTDPYTLARNCRIEGSDYSDLRELTFAIAREIVRPELESIQNLVDYLQLDAPYFSFEPFKDYISDVYEEMLSGIKTPVVLHVCGDSFSVFKELTKLNVDIISLDFTFNDKLLDEVARRNFDQEIGLGCVSTGSLIVEPVKSISSLIKRSVSKFGESRIRFVHPACGERNLPLDTAYQKNINLTLARNEVFLGPSQTAKSVNLSENEYDPNGYFLIQVDPQSQQIFVSFNSYDNIPKFRVQSASGEKLIGAIIDSKIISDTDLGKRHLGYVG
ncbi:MAG TPA: uroporphyrinogen decarboxylase family protein, partial [Nitrososphaerales archaeon]|nr:uroporphyrinogen decarboxylase family protein [Nitrososphaerales archaeon]